MTLEGGGQKQTERPQERTPRPAGNGPTLDVDIDIGGEDVDELLKELDIIEHPERYSQEQRDCGCLRPTVSGLR
jgi:hypothetical protein